MNRLKQLRKSKGMNQSSLADIFGVKQNTVSNWESGVRSIDISTAEKLADYFDCSIDYLFGISENKSGPHRSFSVPVMGYVKAGIPLEAVENIVDYEEVSTDMAQNGECYFGLKIKGSSMEPRMHEGDVVIVKKQTFAENGDIVIALINGCDATVKKFMRHENGISLIAFNPAYPPMFYTKHEVEALPLSIIGKVVELRAKF